ncbi:MAG: HypC/HybG/HupF family hydrogenase formation chaperone [Betaproteobacteria bacterium]|nr:HypC/HybG/HupF family hydrogenase formation chaperone [Betaproteobacteria bacterium]
MCLGIPVQILETHGLIAHCASRSGPRTIDLALVGEHPPGVWLLTFIDAAREVIDAATAARINAALDGLEAAMAGETDLSAHFADLIERTPQLPPHLREAAT